MVELPSFTWAENIYDAPGISTGGDLESQALAKARVVFESNLDPKVFLTFQGDSQRPPTKVWGTIAADGEVVDKNGFPPKLLANDDDLSISNIQWSRTVLVPAPGGTLVMDPLTFVAPLDGDSAGPSTAEIVPPSEPDPDEDPIIIDGGEL